MAGEQAAGEQAAARQGPAPEADAGRLVSGEAVELDVRLARVGSRMLSFLIDILTQALLFVLLLAALFIAVLVWGPAASDDALVAGLFTTAILVAFVIFPVTLETVSGGRSLGKLAVGLRVVRDDSGPIRFRHSLVRVLVGFAADFPGLALPPLTWLASLGVALVNPHGKRLGDLAAGTIVIHDRSPALWGWRAPAPPHLAGWAATLDLSGLDDGLALIIRGYLSRFSEITEPARSHLGYRLSREVARVVTPPPPPGAEGWPCLAAVLAERYRRESGRLAGRRALVAQMWPGLAAPPAMPLPPTPALIWSPPRSTLRS